ncbi:hypothetical protein Bca52824_002039 [Brassica carinata]|uniref:Phorbol-ester/DAG-type domain-containing protein n=1 Tax=Brassica carinata TaxID=52824 RepID=A0A8X7WJG2_BRACI|nr:hypothetical protein Bca52824_002039 [Brassica carinata]
MESEGVLSLPLIHDHPMMSFNCLRKGDCCGRFQSQSEGYYCKICDFSHTLELRHKSTNRCDFCRWRILKLFYRCDKCDFDLDLHCAKYQPPDVIDNFEMHPHKLILLKERIEFDCSAKCRKARGGLPYKCEECDVAFHVDCVWHPEAAELKHPTEVNHSYHSLHPLKLLTGEPPDYSDGKCRLCGRGVDKESFYHCSSCDFTLDMPCVLNPPPHPYICVQCDFMIHHHCLGLPRVIHINRHNHRVSRTSVLGVVNSVCGVCRKKVDWKYGGFSCHKCPGYVVHSICATREDVWNGEELEGVPEEEENIEPYVVIDDITIQHFSHNEHYLRLHGSGVLYEDNKWCNACNHHIRLQSYYGCMDCDFSLHQNCAQCPRKKWHVLHNDRLTLDTNKELHVFNCIACDRRSNGFMYKHGDTYLDVLCGSISEPFVHPSHPHHPLYYIPTEEDKRCNGCNRWENCALRCIEGDCGFVLGFECATLPQVVKHIGYNHPLSLCYGEEEASGKYWCDICEKETNPKEWFYTCKDHLASLHTNCVLGHSGGLLPRSVAKMWGKSYEVVLNNSVTRPFCQLCKSRCMYPIYFKFLGNTAAYICSRYCVFGFSFSGAPER